MEIQVIFDSSKQSIEWNKVRIHLSQRPQSQPRQSSWAFSKLCTIDNYHQSAIFYRRDSIDYSSDNSIIEDSNDEGNNDGSINAISTNNKNSKSASPYHNESGNSKPDGSDNDRLQDQNNTITHSIDTQTVQGDHSDNGGNDNSGGQRNTADDEINALVVKFGEFITGKSKDTLESCIHPWHRPLKGIVCITSAQWHFDSLMDMQLNDPVRKVIHKLGLYHYLQETSNLISLGGCDNRPHMRRYKDEVMNVSQYSAAPDGKRNLRRQFDRFLQEGKVIHKLFTLNPGYMGLIAPTLTQAEYGLLIISVSGADLIPRALLIDRNYNAFEKVWHTTAKEGSAVFQAVSKFSDTVRHVVDTVLAPMPQSGQEQTGKLCSSNHR